MFKTKTNTQTGILSQDCLIFAVVDAQCALRITQKYRTDKPIRIIHLNRIYLIDALTPELY